MDGGVVDGKGTGGGGGEGEGGLNDGLRLGVFGIDRRPRPPRDSCDHKSSDRGVYGGNGGLGLDKRGVTSTNLDEL